MYKAHLKEKISYKRIYMIQIAHRGLSQHFKDNSKKAFEEAIHSGFEMIELDIQLSKDNVIFIYHDTFYDNFLLRDLDFEEIKKLDSDILSFQEFLVFMVAFPKIKIYVDMKGYGEEICKTLPNILDKHLDQKYIQENLYIASFNIKHIQILHECKKGYNLGIITENVFPKEIIDIFINSYHLGFFCFHWTVLDNDINTYIKQKQTQKQTTTSKPIEIFTYTNKSNNILNFMRQKPFLDGIVTNYKF